MKEILPGVYHWTSFHEGIGQRVHSYYIEAIDPAILIDPRMPREGLGWFKDHVAPKHIYLTNRHHYRHAGRFVQEFGATVWCQEQGLHEFTHGEKVRGFRAGAQLPGGVLALNIGTLCDEETVFYLPIHGGILVIGDAIIHTGKRLDFVPDELMGDHPAAVKRGLRQAFQHIVRDYPVRHLLLAHGKPLVKDGKENLERFLAA